MRKVIIGIAGLLVLVVVALMIAPHFINIEQYHERIQAELQERLGRAVTLGQMHLSLLPPRFMVDNAVIGEDARFGQRPFAAVQQLNVSIKLLPLLRKQVEVSSLELRRPQVELMRNAAGQWNFSTLGKTQEKAEKPTAEQPQTPGGSSTPMALDNLRISDGQVAFTDEQQHLARAVYDHIDVTLKNFAPDKPFELALAAHLPGEGNETVSLEGTAGPIQQANQMATPLDAKLKLERVSLAGVQKYLNSPALENMAGVVTGSASVKNQNGVIASAGALTIDQPVVRGVAIGYPIKLDYDVADDLGREQIHVTRARLLLGQTPLSFAGTVATNAMPAQVNGKLNAQDVSLAEAARLAAALGVAFNANTKVDGRLSADVAASGPVSQPTLNGTVAVRNLAVSGNEIPAPVTVPAMDLTLTPQQVRSNEFTATAGNTQLNGQMTVTNYAAANPAVDATLRTTNAQIGDLLTMARAAGVSAVNGVSGSGLLTLNLHVNGPVKQMDQLAFSGAGQIQNAAIKTASLRAPLNVRNANLQFSQNAAQLQNLAASLGSSNASGNFTVRNFAAPNLQFALNVDKVDVNELQQLTGAAPAAQPGKQTSGRWELVPRAWAQAKPVTPAPAAPGIVERMTGGGTVQIGTVKQDQLVLTNLRSQVQLNRGVITLSPLTAQVYGGTENGTITLDTRTTPLTVQAKTTLQKVDANPLISSVSSVKDTIYGLLASNAQAGFRAGSSDEVARTLNGNFELNLANGKITKLNLLNELASAGKFAGMRQNAQAVTEVTSLTGHFNVVNGVATTNDLKAVIAGGSFAGQGLVNLATKELNMHVTAVLSKGFTNQMGGTGNVGGLMQTALANNKGELVIPVVITGTFDHPQVAPDVQKVAEMKLKNLLPTSGNPSAMSAGVLGLLKGGQGGQSGQANGMGGLLGAVTGRQPAQQQSGNNPPAQAQPAQQQNPGQSINNALQGILGGKKK